MTTGEQPCLTNEMPTRNPALALPPVADIAGTKIIQTSEQPPSDSLSQSLQDQADLIEHTTALELEWENRPGKGTFGKDDEIATWYLGKLNDLTEMVDQIKHQAASMIRELENRKLALAYKWGGEFKRIIDAKLHSQVGKKKSVKLLTGTSGYRTSPEKVVVVDEQRALAWAAFNKPEAIRNTLRLTPIKEHIKETGNVPDGIHFAEKQERFYPPITRHELQEAASKQLEGGQ